MSTHVLPLPRASGGRKDWLLSAHRVPRELKGLSPSIPKVPRGWNDRLPSVLWVPRGWKDRVPPVHRVPGAWNYWIPPVLQGTWRPNGLGPTIPQGTWGPKALNPASSQGTWRPKELSPASPRDTQGVKGLIVPSTQGTWATDNRAESRQSTGYANPEGPVPGGLILWRLHSYGNADLIVRLRDLIHVSAGNDNCLTLEDKRYGPSCGDARDWKEEAKAVLIGALGWFRMEFSRLVLLGDFILWVFGLCILPIWLIL